MNPLVLIGAVVLFFALRKKKDESPAASGSSAPGGSGTPQGQVVVLTNAVLENKLPCMDPAGKSRVFVMKELEKEMLDVKAQIDQESQRSQPDEAYIAQLSVKYNQLWNEIKARAVDHKDKCDKFYQDFVKRQSTPATGLPITTAQQKRGI